MADMYFYNQEIDADEGDGAFGDSDVTVNPDEPPVSKLEKYAESDNLFNRQVVARTILETLRAVTDDAVGVAAVLTVMNKLSDDAEPNVRAEIMEQVPHIAMYCQEYKAKLAHVVPHHLLPMVVKFLTDLNNQVRKTSQAALLVLLEQGLVDKADVKEQVCPVIIRLTEENSIDDYRTEAVALLSKMAPLIGKEMSEQIFLERFATLCRDPLFHVRKVCAANFGDFSTVVGSQSTEQVLLPKFFYLCEDVVWGVRKSCADAFMPVSCVCSPAVRHNELSPLFINLLRDQSRWVRMAAFQALGHFISTFADSSITGLLHNDNGEIVISDPEKLAVRLDELEKERAKEALQVGSEPTCEKVSSTEKHAEPLGEDGCSHLFSSQSPPPVGSLRVLSVEEVGREKDDDASKSTAAVEGSEEPVVTDPPPPPCECDVDPVISQEDAKGGHKSECVTESSIGSDQTTALHQNEVLMELCDDSTDDCEERVKASHGTYIEERITSFFFDDALSCEEVRAQTYPNPTKLSTSEAFNNFQYWREPLVELSSSIMETESMLQSADDGLDDEHVVNCLIGGRPDSQNDSSVHRGYGLDDDVDVMMIEPLTSTEDRASESIHDKLDDDSDADVESLARKLGCMETSDGRDSGSSDDGAAKMFAKINATASDVSASDSSEAYKKGGEMDATDPALPKGPPPTVQRIVPQLLIDHYVSMIDPSRVQTVDNEIAVHCAFSLPAVALTLGRSNWPQLKQTFTSLASYMQWKVRRTLASSIHELGVILGDGAQELLPVFNDFWKDLDEVRIGLLKHLADFLKLLKSEDRQKYLPRLSEFLTMDNERNWRFRQELADQLGHLVHLFSPKEVKDNLSPIATILIMDKVSAVRLASVELHTVIVSYLLRSENPSLARVLLAEVMDQLLKVDPWVHRQTYATLCLRIFATGAMDHPQFARYILPNLLDLTRDKVPNVRIVVARALYYISQKTYFVIGANPNHERMSEAISFLAGDRDKDVRNFFSPVPPPCWTDYDSPSAT